MTEPRTAPRFRSALVTGATGFIGNHLVHRLDTAGIAVSAIVRPSSDPARTAALPDATRFHQATGDTSDLAACMRQARPDVIFHLAARFASDHAPEDIAEIINDNVTLTAQLCEAAVETACPAMVSAGTCWQNAGSAARDPAPAPNTLYAASKQAADDVIDYYSREKGLNAITLKIYDSYGPDDPRRKFLTVLREAAANNQTIEASPGDQLLHMVHVDDLVDAFIHAGNLLSAGDMTGRASYTLPSRNAATLREIAQSWMQANEQDVDIAWGDRPHRPGEVMVPWEGEPLPGWSPRIDLLAGLRGC